MNRTAILKDLTQLFLEDAHGGSGQRQMIFNSSDDVSQNIEAVTRGFLNPGFNYDWHSHKNIDEFFFVLNGIGTIFYEDGREFKYSKNTVFYSPSDLKHKIVADGDVPSEFIFIRVYQK